MVSDVNLHRLTRTWKKPACYSRSACAPSVSSAALRRFDRVALSFSSEILPSNVIASAWPLQQGWAWNTSMWLYYHYYVNFLVKLTVRFYLTPRAVFYLAVLYARDGAAVRSRLRRVIGFDAIVPRCSAGGCTRLTYLKHTLITFERGYVLSRSSSI